MRLSQKQAEKYAAYRTRYLFGTLGSYLPASDNCAPTTCTGVPEPLFAAVDRPVGFLRHVGASVDRAGAFLNVDRFDVDVDAAGTPEEFDTALHIRIHHGDNLIYASFAALSFAAEYCVTGQREALEICHNILGSFQRLGMYQRGLNETRDPAGFMLRADAPDDASCSENICIWAADPLDAKSLTPSYDQYCAVIPVCRLIQVILGDAEGSPDDDQLVRDTRARAAERCLRATAYLAGSFWTILWVDASGLRMPEAHRGPYCLHAAFPFAVTAAFSAGSAIEDFFTGQFPLTRIGGVPESENLDLLRSRISGVFRDALPGHIDTYIIERLLAVVKSDVIGGKLDEVIEFFGGSDTNDLIRDSLRGIAAVTSLIGRLLEEVLEALLSWTGMVTGAGAVMFSAILHRYYSKAMLQDVDDALFMTLAECLALFGIETPPNPRIRFDISLSFEVASAPDWWPDLWSWDGWEESWVDERVDVELNLDALWNIPLPIGLLDVLGLLISGIGGALEKKPDLQMLCYLSNLSSKTFATNVIDPVESAESMNNSFAMALAYRYMPSFFEGANAARNMPRFRKAMAEVDTAPDDFPCGCNGQSPWNKNFRWMRGVDLETARKTYPGMDFMLPLMLAASRPEDVAENRRVLLDALSPKFSEQAMAGVFRLPFQGPYAGEKVIVEAQAGGTQPYTVMNIAVEFDRGRGTGEVTIKYKDLSGAAKSEVFSPNDPSRLITVPLVGDPVTAEITTRLKGYIQVEPM